MTFSRSMLFSLYFVVAVAVAVSSTTAIAEVLEEEEQTFVAFAAFAAAQQQQEMLCTLCPSSSIVPGREQLLLQPSRTSEETCSTMALKVALLTFDSKECAASQLSYRETCCSQTEAAAEAAAAEAAASSLEEKDERDLQYTVPISGTTPYGTVQAYNGGAFRPSAYSQTRGRYYACNLCATGRFPTKPFNLAAVLGYGTHKCGDLYHMARNGQIESRMCRPMQNFMRTPCGC